MPGRTRTQTAPPGSVGAHMDAREREQRRRIRRRQVRRRRAVALATLVTVVLAASAPFWPAGGGADRAASAGERDGGRARPLAGGRQEASGEAARRPRADRPTGTLVRVGGRSAVAGRGSLLRFVVEVEGGLGVDRRAFAHAVETVLFDPRGWRTSGFQFQRVSSGPVDFRVALASPDTTDRLCAPLRTRGRYSCHANGRAVLNVRRWFDGAPSYGDDVRRYRIYLVNHEVGHALGHGHTPCPAPGALAPVMLQQTKGVAPCIANPWPLPEER